MTNKSSSKKSSLSQHRRSSSHHYSKQQSQQQWWTQRRHHKQQDGEEEASPLPLPLSSPPPLQSRRMSWEHHPQHLTAAASPPPKSFKNGFSPDDLIFFLEEKLAKLQVIQSTVQQLSSVSFSKAKKKGKMIRMTKKCSINKHRRRRRQEKQRHEEEKLRNYEHFKNIQPCCSLCNKFTKSMVHDWICRRHSFHLGCIQRWQKYDNPDSYCPICTRSV